MTLQDRIDELVAQHGSLRAVARVTEIDVGYLSRLHYLRLTKDGHPGHPLYLPASLRPVEWVTPNAEVSGGGTPSAGLPGWQANGETE